LPEMPIAGIRAAHLTTVDPGAAAASGEVLETAPGLSDA
jgi:hypothetical protein